MKKIFLFLFFTLSITLITGCKETSPESGYKIRPLRDTIGFAQYNWQMDSLMARIHRSGWRENKGQSWKVAICPHDDYTYVGSLYPELLQNVRASNIILIGVAHKASALGIQDSLVFDSYTHWKGPWKDVPVSPARDELFDILKNKFAITSDTLQTVEHSVESMIPFLQYFNRDISVVSILVPAMSPDRMEECGKALSLAINSVAEKHNWKWGTDFALIITSDAVHYGNEDWGNADYAFFGCDTAGNNKAVKHEHEIIDNSLKGEITPEKIRLFSDYTISTDDYRQYKWTWCGRYSIPVGLWAANLLNEGDSLTGYIAGYSTSITSTHIDVDDLMMGSTAIATDCHWVGYPAIDYR
jgi:MEMO1 family protein